MNPAVTASIPDPNGLVYDTITWNEMKTKLEAWGFENISVKKQVAWKLFKKYCDDNYGKDDAPEHLLLDPKILSVTNFTKRTLMDALRLRNIPFDPRVQRQALFNLLEAWAIDHFPQPLGNAEVGNGSITANSEKESGNDLVIVDDIDPGFSSGNEDYDDVCITTPRKRGRSDYDDVCDSGSRRVHFPPRFDELWLKSANFIAARGSQSDNSSHLERALAQDLQVGDVVYLFHEKQYYFYSFAATDSGSKVATLISTVEGGKPAPFEVSAIPASMTMWRFTPASFAHFQAIEARSTRLRVAWPAVHDPALKKSRQDPFPRLGDPGGNPRDIYADTLARALQDGTKTTRTRTPRGNDMTVAAAAVFSNDPDRLLDTGVVHIYRYLHHFSPWAHLRDGYTSYAHGAWGVEAWRVQLQPFHFTLLVRDVMRVDIRLFADLRDVMSNTAAEARIDSQFDGIDKLVDLPTDLNIIGADLARLKVCLHNFGYTVTVVFHLSPDLSAALLKLIKSAVIHAMSYQFGPSDPHAPLMYFYIANRCQAFVAQRFRRVLIGEWDGRGSLLNALNDPFPDLTVSSPFSADVLLIRGTGKAPECLPPFPGTKKTIHPVVGSPSLTPSAGVSPAPAPARIVTPAPAPSPSPPNPPGASPKAGKRLCAWFNTAEGCSMSPGQCRGDHRDASTNKEKKMLSNFLKSHPDRHPK